MDILQKMPENADDPQNAVFMTRALTKVYEMGAVQVHALRGVALDLYAGELRAYHWPVLS